MFSLKKTVIVILLGILPELSASHYYFSPNEISIQAPTYINEGNLEAHWVTLHAPKLFCKGTIQGAHVVLTSDHLSCQGTIVGKTSCTMRAKKIEGDGTIEGFILWVICDEFDFRGTLSCDLDCTIYTKKALDLRQFRRKGAGRVTLIVTNHRVELFTQDNLVNSVSEKFRSRCLLLSEAAIDKAIKKVRTNAVLNKLVDTTVLEQIRKNMEKEAQFHKNLMHIKRDNAALGMLIAKLGATAFGLSLSYALFENRHDIAQKLTLKKRDKESLMAMAITGGIISLVPLACAPSSFSAWLHPQHQEKYEKYSLMIEKLDLAMKTVRVPEETITTLPFNLA